MIRRKPRVTHCSLKSIMYIHKMVVDTFQACIQRHFSFNIVSGHIKFIVDQNQIHCRSNQIHKKSIKIQKASNQIHKMPKQNHKKSNLICTSSSQIRVTSNQF